MSASLGAVTPAGERVFAGRTGIVRAGQGGCKGAALWLNPV